jgi:C_GCAxxG_C_C family probable redox protein
MKKAEQAVKCFKEGFSCSQAMLSTYGEGIDRETALKISAPFGGGIARRGETCGAVTGALMAIGLKYAKGKETREVVYGLVNEFVRKFEARNKSIVCKTLLGCDLSTPEGVKTFKDNNLIETRCVKFVQDAAEILEELIGADR